MISDSCSPQPGAPGAGVKRAICHIRATGFFLAVLAILSIPQARDAKAETAAGIEQTFAGSLITMPAENLGATFR
jgi:hypothetical protein